MNVLVSIKPKYVTKIISEEKRFEYRKRLFTQPINEVLIYSSSPVKKVIGKFKYDGFHYGKPEKIWIKTKTYSGISGKEFFEYFAGKSIAYAIKIVDLTLFDPPVDPYLASIKFTPPQSFMYIKSGDFQ